MRIFILIIVIVLLLPSSSDCQDSILVSKNLLTKLANKLDSFDVLKIKEKKYIAYADECDSMVAEQKKIIHYQDTVVWGMQKQLKLMSDIELEYQKGLEANTDYIKALERQNKGSKIRNKVYLIGGCVISIGLTTALLISLIQ